MKAVKEDGVFTCVTSSREDIRAHLGSIAEIRRKRELKQAEEFLEEKDIRIHDGHKKMVEDVYNEIMDGRSNYPVHPQAELLVEADRIAVWEAQLANPDLKFSPRTTKLCKGSKSPYLRFIELCESLDDWKEKVKQTAARPIHHGPDQPLDIDGLSLSLMTQLRVGCEQWVKDYKDDGQSNRKKLFDCVKVLAKETHDMRAASRSFSRMKWDFMVDKHFDLELAVSHLRFFIDNLASMEATLECCEERVRAHEEKKKKFESSWEFEEWTREGLYVQEFSAEEFPKRKKILMPKRDQQKYAMIEEVFARVTGRHRVDGDHSDTPTTE